MNKNTNVKKRKYRRYKQLTNQLVFTVEITQDVYIRSSQTSPSFQPGSQSYAVNLGALLKNSNNFSAYVKQGTVGVYERLKVHTITLKWEPAYYLPVVGVFEVRVFGFKYFEEYSTDSVLPSGYQGNYNKVDYEIVPQITNIFRAKNLTLPRNYLTSEGNRQCIGQETNVYNFVNYGDQFGGILTLIASTPQLNTSMVNEKLGSVKITYVVQCFNPVG